jgi:long-chain acyl-CoA synthetase
VPHYEVFAVGDDGVVLPAGEVGTLYCRHLRQDRVFEYHGAPEKTEAAHLEPGVFTMGDIGRVDGDGFVHLADRAANVIISGGVNIYPAEVEHALAEHPAVADVAVFGIPDDEWGEQVKAAVELVPGTEASAALEAEILDPGLRPRAAGGLQGAAVDRRRGRAAPAPHREAVHPPAAGPVLAGARPAGVTAGTPSQDAPSPVGDL